MWPTSESFKQALRRPIQEVRCKLEILDTDFNPVVVLGGSGPDKGFIDGVVDVDITRGTRRTLAMSLLNEDGEFSPTGQWGGLFYVNRIIRPWRGLVISESVENPVIEYVPVGTFMVDKTETLVERSMSTVVLSGSDLWKKFHKAQFPEPRTFPAGMLINDFVRTLADESGVTNMVLDPLDSRTANSDRLQVAIAFEKGDVKGDALLKVCNNYSIDIFFDPMGVLRTEDTRSDISRATVWSYGYGDEAGDLAYLIRSVTDDERLYNHVHVTGTGIEESPFTAERMDTDPLSPTNIDRIGDRVYRMVSGVLASQESVDLAAGSLFTTTRIIGQTVNMEAICHPALEGNDVLEVIEPNYAELASNFIVSTFNVPLLTSRQKISMKRVINLA
jgi:hypothetical protein